MAYTEFYVTKGASAADLNGGGPNLGASDGPIVTKTNCSSNVGGTTITNDDVDGWGTAAQDDWLCFDAAGVQEYVQIASVAGDVITLATNPGTVTGSLSGKTVNVGGAWSTAQHAADTVTTSFLNDSVDDPPRVNIGAGTYTENVQFDTNTGSLTVPIIIQGYDSAPGDIPATRPTITQAGAGDTVEVSNPVHYLTLADLIIEKTGTAGRALDSDTRTISCYRCKMILGGSSGLQALYAPASNTYFEECELVCSSSAAGSECGDAIYGLFYGCVFRVTGSANSTITRPLGTFVNCVMVDGAGDCVKLYSNCKLLLCTVRNATGDGLSVDATRGNLRVSNCIITSHGAYGIDAGNGSVLGSNNNLGGGAEANTSGASTGKYYDTGHADNNADPLYVSAPSDLRLQSGSPDKGTGVPTTMPGESYATSLDRGGVQRQEPAGGGGLLVHPGMSGGARG